MTIIDIWWFFENTAEKQETRLHIPSPTLKSTIESTDIESATAVDQTVPSRESAVVSPARAPESLQRTSGRPASTALAHNYVKAELVKISIMGSIVIAALVGLSFLI